MQEVDPNAHNIMTYIQHYDILISRKHAAMELITRYILLGQLT